MAANQVMLKNHILHAMQHGIQGNIWCMQTSSNDVVVPRRQTFRRRTRIGSGYELEGNVAKLDRIINRYQGSPYRCVWIGEETWSLLGKRTLNQQFSWKHVKPFARRRHLIEACSGLKGRWSRCRCWLTSLGRRLCYVPSLLLGSREFYLHLGIPIWRTLFEPGLSLHCAH